ncbi:MAG: hypothetical protein WBP45_07870, partial [Daejeonella sp.]
MNLSQEPFPFDIKQWVHNYCETHLCLSMNQYETDIIRQYIFSILDKKNIIPIKENRIDWLEISSATKLPINTIV